MSFAIDPNDTRDTNSNNNNNMNVMCLRACLYGDYLNINRTDCIGQSLLIVSYIKDKKLHWRDGNGKDINRFKGQLSNWKKVKQKHVSLE